MGICCFFFCFLSISSLTFCCMKAISSPVISPFLGPPKPWALAGYTVVWTFLILSYFAEAVKLMQGMLYQFIIIYKIYGIVGLSFGFGTNIILIRSRIFSEILSRSSFGTKYCALRIPIFWTSWKGCMKKQREKRTQPSIQTSACVSTTYFMYLSIISGGLYIIVVYFSKSSIMSSRWLAVHYDGSSVLVLADPKSQSLKLLPPSRMFSTLMSLCAIPFSCRCFMPLQTSIMIWMIWPSVILPLYFSSKSKSVPPEHSSLKM